MKKAKKMFVTRELRKLRKQKKDLLGMVKILRHKAYVAKHNEEMTHNANKRMASQLFALERAA